MSACEARAVIDVILPVLDEADALPRVLEAIPPGHRPIVVDNGSTDGSGRIAAELGAEVVEEPRPGFGSACFAGLQAATSDVVVFMDCDGSLNPAEIPRLTDRVTSGEADLVLGRRLAERGSWPVHSRIANAFLARLLSRRGQIHLRDLGPMRAARREALLNLGIEDRRFGWPLEMVLRAQAAGWRLEEVPVGYAPRIGRSKVTGTVRGTARAISDMSRVLREVKADSPLDASIVVIAKEPRAGHSKTRLTPPLEPAQAAAVAEAALADTLEAVASAPVRRRIIALDGSEGSWLGPGFEVVPQVEGGLDRRLAAAVNGVEGPVLVIGMDTPQVTPSMLTSAIESLLVPGTDAVLGRADDGGYWAIGLRNPDGAAIDGVPMSEPTTGDEQARRLAELGLSVTELPALRDCDHFDDALAIAAAAPETRFAACLGRIEAETRSGTRVTHQGARD